MASSEDIAYLRSFDRDLREALYALLWVWKQFSDLEHRRMSAPEEAMDLLERLGLGEDDGWSFAPNERGRVLMASSLDSPEDPIFGEH